MDPVKDQGLVQSVIDGVPANPPPLARKPTPYYPGGERPAPITPIAPQDPPTFTATMLPMVAADAICNITQEESYQLPDGRRVFQSGVDQLRIVSLQAPEVLLDLSPYRIAHMTSLSHGRFAVGLTDWSVRIYEPEGGRFQEIPGPEGRKVAGLVAQGDNQLMVSYSDGTRSRWKLIHGIWRVSTMPVPQAPAPLTRSYAYTTLPGLRPRRERQEITSRGRVAWIAVGVFMACAFVFMFIGRR